jgi:hypothetical protein
MKNILILALLFMIQYSFAQGDSKTLVKTFDPEGAAQIKFDFKHNAIKPKTWNNNKIRIQMEIRSNYPETLLNQLVKAGRYTLEGVKKGETYVLNAPNLSKKVTVGGKDLQEEIIIHIEMPDLMNVNANLLSFKTPGQKFSKDAISLSVKTVCTDPSVAAQLSKEKEQSKMSATAASPKASKKKTGKESSSDIQMRQAHFGEVLIDGVKLEVE